MADEQDEMKPTSDAPSAEAPEDDPLAKAKIPPASLSTLVEMLASQIMVHLGLYPDPVRKKPMTRPNLARHYIDTLAVIQDKTQGNLSKEEQELLERVLHDVRMMFVQATKA